MLPNCLTHVATQNSMSFPIVPELQADLRVCTPRPLFRSCHQLLWRPKAVVGSSSRLNFNKKSGSDKRMSWFYEIKKEVRDYELNQFGVVNTAIYNNYCEYGTYKLFENIGFDADIKLAVFEFWAKYLAPLKRRDIYLLNMRIADYSSTRLYVEGHIVRLPNHESVLRFTYTLVHLDENLRPFRITPSMVSKLNHFFHKENNK